MRGWGGHKDGGPLPSSINRVCGSDDGPTVLVARRREGGADAGAVSPPSSLLLYHSPSGGVVWPVVHDWFWRVLEIDAENEDGVGEERLQGHRRDERGGCQDYDGHEQARNPQSQSQRQCWTRAPVCLRDNSESSGGGEEGRCHCHHANNDNNC